MTTREQRYPAAGPLEDVVRTWLDAGCPAGAPTRRASTVMVLRAGQSGDAEVGGSGVEVFMQRRVATMAFAPSMWVFPGGGVDPRDGEAEPPWAGPSPDEWAARLDVPREDAVELVCAAVREVFEECGVLLAGPDGTSVLRDVSGVRWQQHRADLLAKESSLSQVLSEERLVLRSDLLSLQDHWVTPEFEKKRYDTYFFAALLPEGQIADDQTTEADVSRWVRPAELLAALTAGEVMMLAPTSTNLERLTQADAPAAVVGSTPQVIRVMPVAHYDGDQVVMTAQLPV
ncbi:NUDIX hydrolase [Dermatophilaceae bacterium Sec6.4]